MRLLTALCDRFLLFIVLTSLWAALFVGVRGCLTPNNPDGSPTPTLPGPEIRYFQALPTPAPLVPKDFRWAADQSPDYTQRQPTPGADGYCHQITRHLMCCYRYVYEPTPTRGPRITPRVLRSEGTGCYEVP